MTIDIGDCVGHSTGAGAAAGTKLQGLTIDHGGAAGELQCLLIILFCQGDGQGDGEILVVVAGGFQGDSDDVTGLAAGNCVGQLATFGGNIIFGQ